MPNKALEKSWNKLSKRERKNVLESFKDTKFSLGFALTSATIPVLATMTGGQLLVALS